MRIRVSIGLLLWLLAGPVAAETAPPLGPASLPPSEMPAAATGFAQDSLLRGKILRAWTLPAPSLDARVERTIRAGYQLGMRNLEAPARAVLLASDLGDPIPRAEAAVRLAPNLPAAHAALATARFEDGDLPGAAAATIAAATRVPGHLEASLWSRAQGYRLLSLALAGGTLLFLTLVAVIKLPRFVRDMSVIRDDLPTSSRFALLACVVLLPTVLGEGPAGLLLAMGFVAIAYGTMWQRATVAAVAFVTVGAMYPLMDASARARAAMAGDPLVLAAHATEHGFPSASELARVTYAGESEPFAARALALRAKRVGDLEGSNARYSRLLAMQGADATPDLLNNAAGVALDSDQVDEAIRLYETASKREPSPAVLFNLSQAYGKAIRLDEQGLALAEAQSIDPAEVARLTGEFGATALGLVADIALPADLAEASLARAGEGERLARLERARVAPGWLGSGLVHASAAFAIALGMGLALGMLLSRRVGENGDDYDAIARILQEKGGDSSTRMQRLGQIRERQALIDRARGLATLVIPGAAGVIRGRPILGWIGATLFSLTACLVWMDTTLLPDPLALGALPVAVRVVGTSLGILAYLAVLGTTLVMAERN